jgi:hypothetical protein
MRFSIPTGFGGRGYRRRASAAGSTTRLRDTGSETTLCVKQENRRTSFELDGVCLELDEWPMIPPYLEIEGDARDDVLRVASATRRPSSV